MEGMLPEKTNKGTGDIINIGSNFEISIKNTVNLISQLMGKKITIRKEKKRLRPKTSEVERLLASNKKAKKLLKWKPKYTLDEGLEITASYYS